MFIKCRTSYKCKIKILKTTFIKKEKKIKKENEKVENRKLENLGNLGNIIPSFLISKFSILTYSQNRVSEFSEISECSEFSIWPRESLYRKSHSLQTNVKIIELHVVHKSRP